MSDGTDVRAVEARLTDAGKAFGALRKGVFASCQVTAGAKRRAYEALILSILLFGCEAWCLTEVLMQRLRVFHAQCARAMCRVTRKHTWEHHISSEQLRERLGLDSIELYIHARQLRWLGHVRRMGPERLPRLMLSAWVAHKRPAGAPQFTYGRTIAKAMDVFDLDPVRWPELAADRGAWRTMLRSAQWRGAAGLPAGATAAGSDADVALPRAAAARRRHAHQRRDRRVEARRERQLLTTSRCAACPSL